MAYKDPLKQKQAHEKWYRKHRERRIREISARQKRIKEWFQEYKRTFACSHCGESDPLCLDFHHVVPSSKEGDMSSLIRRGFSKESIEREIAKCVPLCANCHKKEHFEKKNGTGQIRIRRRPQSETFTADHDAPNVVSYQARPQSRT